MTQCELSHGIEDLCSRVNLYWFQVKLYNINPPLTEYTVCQNKSTGNIYDRIELNHNKDYLKHIFYVPSGLSICFKREIIC